MLPRLGIAATIVMPVTTPFVKIAATVHGAEVVLHGETVAERRRAPSDRGGAGADLHPSLRRPGSSQDKALLRSRCWRMRPTSTCW